MRKLLFAALLALTVCGIAEADLYVKIGTSATPWPKTPYIITPLSGVPDWMPASFETFCVERFTTFSPGNYWATIDDEIMDADGSNPPLTSLQESVKKTYAAFLNGHFPTSTFIMNDIQQYIWLAQNYNVDPLDTAISDSIEKEELI